MPEPHPARISSRQREHLLALGIELLELRRPKSSPAAGQTQHGSTDSVALQPRLRLSIDDADRAAPRLLAIVRAVGLQSTEITGAAGEGMRSLAFGPVPGAVDVILPPLSQLQSAAAKRAIWPALRRLRRELLPRYRRE